MHARLSVLLLLVVVILVSGCTTGQVARRQAAEPAEVLQQDNTTDYYEIEAAPEDCICPGSLKTCPDGFNATCGNECTNGTCSRCVPSCSGHEKCNESWFCSEWQPCGNGSQSRRCMDSSFCNKTVIAESRTCETDRCSSNSGCPAESNCTRYFCEGSPKACKPYVIIPCCGDGVCDGGEDCISDCPTAPCNCSQLQCPPCNQTQNQSQNGTSYTWHIVITEVMYNPNVTGQYLGEFVEFLNDGNVSVDISGWMIVDNSKANNMTATLYTLAPLRRAIIITENTTVQPQAGALVLSTGASRIGNGLGESDIINITYSNGTTIDFIVYDNPGCARGYSLKLLENKTWACGNIYNGTPGF